jgi:uncharacterized protein (TIGR02145 family)
MRTENSHSICFLVLMEVFLILSISFETIAQNYQISFSGTGAAATVTSVQVENLTQCSSLNLNGDDILNLTANVGINDLSKVKDNNMILYPNPMNGVCSIDFETSVQANTTLELYDMSGKRILHLQELLPEGHHTYSISGIISGIYLLKIESDKYSYKAKLVCKNMLTGKPEIIHTGTISVKNRQDGGLSTEKHLKSSGSIIDMKYNAGDILKLTGKSGIYKTVVMLVPAQSQAVIFNFVSCIDAESYNYPIVQIGTKIWTAENLKTTQYRDGTNIPPVPDNTEWKNLKSGAYCEYDNKAENGITYGKLYNAYAVEDSRNLCPIDWHVATDEDWSALTDLLGNWTDVGGKLRDACSSLWLSPNTGATNETGFTALPGGYRSYSDGTFIGIKQNAYYWTSTAADSPVSNWGRLLYYYSNNVYKGRYSWADGFSVRCVKD